MPENVASVEVALARYVLRRGGGRAPEPAGRERVRTRPLNPAAVAQGGLPGGLRLFVIPRRRYVGFTRAITRDAQGKVLRDCKRRRCARPAPTPAPRLPGERRTTPPPDDPIPAPAPEGPIPPPSVPGAPPLRPPPPPPLPPLFKPLRAGEGGTVALRPTSAAPGADGTLRYACRPGGTALELDVGRLVRDARCPCELRLVRPDGDERSLGVLPPRSSELPAVTMEDLRRYAGVRLVGEDGTALLQGRLP